MHLPPDTRVRAVVREREVINCFDADWGLVWRPEFLHWCLELLRCSRVAPIERVHHGTEPETWMNHDPSCCIFCCSVKNTKRLMQRNHRPDTYHLGIYRNDNNPFASRSEFKRGPLWNSTHCWWLLIVDRDNIGCCLYKYSDLLQTCSFTLNS